MGYIPIGILSSADIDGGIFEGKRRSLGGRNDEINWDKWVSIC